MRIALAQLNPTVGDLSGNSRLIADAVQLAIAQGAELVVTSELVLCGYPPKDLLLRQGYVAACDRAVEDLARRLPPHVGVLVGHPTARHLPQGRVANAASLLYQGGILSTVHKTLLPNYDVFDEERYFRPATERRLMEFKGFKLGVHICEDAWWGEANTFYHQEPDERVDPVTDLARQGAQLLINLSASPFEVDKPGRRFGILHRHATSHRLPILFVNQVGGNDDLVFDGHSHVLDEKGRAIARLAGFETDLKVFDFGKTLEPVTLAPHRREQLLLDALTLGLKDYLRKCGFSDVVFGSSGGIDSALACAIAARAVGPQHVHALLMPSRYSSDHSIEDARLLSERLGVDWEIVPIDEVHRAYERLPLISSDLASQPAGLADQNLQARIRGAIVMTRSNRHHWMAIATGNKSELAVGYCTIYGDMCGGFAVLADLFKQDVYAVSRYVNELAGQEVIPVSIIDKAPSAELAPNQFDQDTLPPYPILDAILKGLIETEQSPQELAEMYSPETVRWVVKALDRNEFKRRQMPPGIKLSQRAFGSGRRMPMASRISYDFEE
ncbi:MAG: NAD+ synthase [Planctomycetaceae bacterium]